MKCVFFRCALCLLLIFVERAHASELLILPPAAAMQGEWSASPSQALLHLTKLSPAPADWPDHYIGTAEPGDGKWSDNQICEIRSPSFVVTEQFYALRLSGGAKYDTAYISIKDHDSGRELWRITGAQSVDLDTRYIDLGMAIGDRVFLEIIDRDTGPFGFIRFGGFRVADQEAARDNLVTEQLGYLHLDHARTAALNWLKLNARPQNINRINETLRTARGEQLYSVIWLLRHLDHADEETVRLLLNHSQSGNEMLASYSLLLLGEIQDVQIPIEEIATLMREGKTERIRREAMNSLGKMQNSEALAALQSWTPPEGNLRAHLQWVLDSRGFTRTELPAFTPGTMQRGWLDGMEFWVYLPSQWNKERKWPVLVAVHGTWGNGLMYNTLLNSDADQHGFIVIAPTFDTANWWDFGKFGIVCSSKRSDLQFLRILDGIAPHVSIDPSRICIYGHSEGGQFANRMQLVYPTRFRRSASSGSKQLVWPNFKEEFPFGVQRNPNAPDIQPDPSALLRGNYTIVMGELEGPEKVAEVRQYQAVYNQYAHDTGLNAGIRLIINPKVGHSGHRNYPLVREWLIEGMR